MDLGNSNSPKSPFMFSILNCKVYTTITAILIWNINFVSGFKPKISSRTPTTSNVIEPKAKRKEVVEKDRSSKKNIKIAMVKNAAKYMATPPKIGTCKECDFLADGESVRFLAIASSRRAGTKYIDNKVASNSPKRPKISSFP